MAVSVRAADIATLQMDNDSIGNGRDTAYSHGTWFSYAPDKPLSQSTQSFFNHLAMGLDDSWRAEYFIGQSIYTPDDLKEQELIEDQRPYAGYLYTGMAINHRQFYKAYRLVERWEMSVGIIGPASGAEAIQRGLHSLVGSPTPRGWEHQLANELGLGLVYQRQWIIDAGQWLSQPMDVSPSAGGSLGNVFTHIDAGFRWRMGPGIHRDDGGSHIRPSMPGSNRFDLARNSSWYFYLAAQGRAVIHNIFLDGNTFADSHSVDKEPLVGDLSAGFVWLWQDMRIAYSNLWRSREYRSQPAQDGYGTVSFSWAL